MKQIKLINRAKKGDSEAFEELLQIHSEQLYRTAFLYVKNRDDALDVVQDTAYKAFKEIRKLRHNKYFKTWLMRILINSAQTLLRKQKKVSLSEDIGEVFSTKDASREEHLDLADAIQKLQKNQREAITLFYFHDSPIKEIAYYMKVPENTVKTYLKRGKHQLKKMLEGKGYDEGRLLQRKV